MQFIKRRKLFAASLSLLSLACACPALAQTDSFPAKPIKIIVPFPPGGQTDAIARLLAQRLGETLKQAVMVDNRPGANTMIGTNEVARASADGYTLLFTQTSIVQNPMLYPKVNYDVFKNFIPVSHVGDNFAFFVVPPNNPANNIKEFIAWANAQPQPPSFASTGLGSSTHIYGEMLNKAGGMKLMHVPYKGEAPVVADMLGGRVQSGFISGFTAAQLKKEGKIKVLASTGLNRSTVLPDVATFGQQGLAGIDQEGWMGIFAPAGTPKAIVDKLAAGLHGAINAPDINQRILGMSLTPVGGTSADFQAVVRRTHDGWSRAIKAVDVRLE